MTSLVPLPTLLVPLEAKVMLKADLFSTMTIWPGSVPACKIMLVMLPAGLLRAIPTLEVVIAPDPAVTATVLTTGGGKLPLTRGLLATHREVEASQEKCRAWLP